MKKVFITFTTAIFLNPLFYLGCQPINICQQAITMRYCIPREPDSAQEMNHRILYTSLVQKVPIQIELSSKIRQLP